MPSDKRNEADREVRGEQRSMEGMRAHELREQAGRESPGRVGQPTAGVSVQVCLECGREYTFDDDPVPDDLTCEKCGGVVFRSFFEPFGDDEAHQDFRETTERDLAPDDPEGDATTGDLVDLNKL